MATEAPKGGKTIEIPLEREGPREPRRTRSLTRSTGPKTLRGKRKSRYNAIKHGIFAEALLYDESRPEYENLLQGLMDHFQPIGQLEELLVEKLGMLWWRYHRLLAAESAEIEEARLRQEEFQERPSLFGASLFPKEEVGVLGRAVLARDLYDLLGGRDRLRDLRRTIAREGLDWERDEPVLRLLYGNLVEEEMKKLRASAAEAEPQADLGENSEGEPDFEQQESMEEGNEQNLEAREEGMQAGQRSARPPRLPFGAEKDFLSRYFFACVTTATNRRVHAREKKEILRLLGDKLDFFEQETDKLLARRVARKTLGAKTVQVPSGDAAERLQRYEAALERSIDRTLQQLERLQRMREGQPVPPTLKLDVTGD